MSCKIKYSRIVFKGVIKDYTRKFIKKGGPEPIRHSYYLVNRLTIQNVVPKGNLIMTTSRSKTFH